jgi:hypothetical protein
LNVKKRVPCRVAVMAKKITIASALYLTADVACAIAVNGAALYALHAQLWGYVSGFGIL